MHLPLLLAASTALSAHSARAALNASALFPIPFLTGFTTAPTSAFSDARVLNVPLSLESLRATKVTSGVTEAVVPAPGDASDDTLAFEAVYPAGSWTPSNTPRGGFGFYLPGPAGFDFAGAKEIVFAYAVLFQDGFEFNKGGKLPGPYGGSSDDEAFACSGGRQTDRDQCFDLRLMFRTNGMGEVYAYLPEVPENDVILDIPGSVEDTSFGWSIARGAFSFVPGEWTVVAQRVRLNDLGVANGELELFVNGESRILATQLIISQNETTTFKGAHFQTFFGGSTSDWASPINQSAWFADISGAIVA